MPLDTDIRRRTAARGAAFGYVALFVLAIFANFVVKQGMIDPTDALATTAAIREQEGLFRLGLASFVLIFLIDVAVAWGLYVLFLPAGRTRSLVAAWFRIVYTVMLGAASVFLFVGLEVSLGAADLGPDVALLMFAAFDFAWLVGLIAFGVHLILIGALIIRSRIAPRAIGAILMIAGAAYGLDTLLHIVLSDYEPVGGVMLAVVATTSIVSELVFTIWLLLAGRRSSPATDDEAKIPVAA